MATPFLDRAWLGDSRGEFYCKGIDRRHQREGRRAGVQQRKMPDQGVVVARVWPQPDPPGKLCSAKDATELSPLLPLSALQAKA